MLVNSRRFFSTGAPAKVGFIGLGNMGLPMAKNMLKAGHTVTAFDLSAEACKAAEEAGAQIATKAGHCAKEADFVLTMLPNTTHVIEARAGDDGIYANASEGAVIVDSSTISPIVSGKMGKEENGFIVADAPVSGGVGGA